MYGSDPPHMQNSGGIFSRRTLLSLVYITIAVFICATLTAGVGFGTCVNNYHTQMPMHPQAGIISQTNSWQNYFGLGELHEVHFVPQEESDVISWYAVWKDNRREARRLNPDAPAEWTGEFRVQAIEGGSRVDMIAQCF